jgi:hypothetical protein
MRFIATALVCAGVLLTAAACDPTDKHYFTQGVGTRLSSADVTAEVNQTNLQNAYVEQICRQAGLQPSPPDAAVATCNGPDPRTTWTLFVQAGMNDIDQRCDAYLTWLDEFKRSRDPILNQITQTGTATGNILLAAGVHQLPITMVANAFGLAGQTFTNLSSSLILELPHSTVQAVVLGRQKDIRDEVFGTPGNLPQIAVVSRPAAIYVLRSYLRLCMPMTIETEVNNTATTLARGGPGALLSSDPLISPGNVGKTIAPVVRIKTTFSLTDATKVLRVWLRPNGIPSSDHAKTLDDFLVKKQFNPKPLVGTFLIGAQFSDARTEFARQLGLIP